MYNIHIYIYMYKCIYIYIYVCIYVWYVCYVRLYYVMLCFLMLCNVMLCYICYYVMLCYIMLCYVCMCAGARVCYVDICVHMMLRHGWSWMDCGAEHVKLRRSHLAFQSTWRVIGWSKLSPLGRRVAQMQQTSTSAYNEKFFEPSLLHL
jgi:hypothetical protein